MEKHEKPPSKVDELRHALEKKRKAEERSQPVPPSQDANLASEDFTSQLHAAEEEAKQHYDKLLRVMAEFENYRKRMSNETTERVRYANEKLLAELLPALDDLDRVLDHVPPDASDEVKALAHGVELVSRTLANVLSKFDLCEVEALGKPFHPAEHEALSAVESDAHDPDVVIAVHRKGYWLGERLLRPALVTISKKAGGA